MKIFSDYSLEELKKELADIPAFRAKQIFDAVLQAKDYDSINFSADLKARLSKEYILKPVEIFKVYTSKDGTKKYLLKSLIGLSANPSDNLYKPMPKASTKNGHLNNEL